jgi:hypothetical protein
MTESGFLVLRFALNAPCLGSEGWTNRFVINVSEGGQSATFKGIDDPVEYSGMRVQSAACSFDFSTCQSPESVM